MQRFKLTIEYDGRPYCGWQKQNEALSVQECIETAFYKFCGETVETIVAGRTDAGVHASGQVCHVDMPRQTSAKEIFGAVNAYLRPNPIAVVDVEEVDDNFNARFGATMRHYMYRVICRRAPIALDRGTAWQVYTSLDVEKMRMASAYLVSEEKRDFSAFRASACQAKHAMRSVNDISFEVIPEKFTGQGTEIRMHISAISFLHHQVRNIMGTLKNVGEGRWEPEYVKEILESCDRNLAGPTAPAEGLYFTRVEY